MIALSYEGTDKKEHTIQFNDHEELSCLRLALEAAKIPILRVWVISA